MNINNSCHFYTLPTCRHYTDTFYLWHNIRREIPQCPFKTYGNWGPEKLNDLLKVVGWEVAEQVLELKFVWLRSSCFFSRTAILWSDRNRSENLVHIASHKECRRWVPCQLPSFWEGPCVHLTQSELAEFWGGTPSSWKCLPGHRRPAETLHQVPVLLSATTPPPTSAKQMPVKATVSLRHTNQTPNFGWPKFPENWWQRMHLTLSKPICVSPRKASRSQI